MEELRKQFEISKVFFEAIASDVRLSIIYQLLACGSKGMRICEIKTKKCITRPTLSHHFKLLLKAKIIKFYKVGTKNYYYLSVDSDMIESCILLLNNLKEIN
ncbi:MAG: winged helix-turn-helix domain-containing protein, partial [Anaeroplasmataceae bacterium]|nr:winged helix-turn-helix domain-containing protein [Anaeroplasmataceae bacterium]